MIKYVSRFLTRQKIFTTINIVGLALSLACCIVLTRYLHREMTIDDNQIDESTIVELVHLDSNERANRFEDDCFKKIASDGITEVCRYMPMEDATVSSTAGYFIADVMKVDSTFLHFFDLNVVGDRSVLSRPDGVLISRQLANKLFPGEDPLGKEMKVMEFDMTVGAVFDAPECKQSVSADVYMLDNPEAFHGFFSICNYYFAWLRVSSTAEIERINQAISQLPAPEEPEGDTEFRIVSPEYRFRLLGLREAYLQHSERLEYHIMQMTNASTKLPVCKKSTFRILVGMDILILLVGLFNFVNLYMVLMQRRKREWAVRKVFGQKPQNLFVQVWAENLVLTLLAIFLAWLLVEVFNPVVSEMLGEPFGYSIFDIQLTLDILIAVPLIAAIYPFVQYVLQPPVTSLKETASGRQSIRVRLCFLAFQYLLTFGILVCAIWFNSHLRQLQERTGAIHPERVLVTDFCHTGNMVGQDMQDYDRIQGAYDEVKNCPLIEYYDLQSNANPLTRNVTMLSMYKNGEELDTEYPMIYTMSSKSMFRIFDIPVVMGDLAFERDDFSDPFIFAVNETAWKQLGFDNLDEAYINRGIYNYNGETIEGVLMNTSTLDAQGNRKELRYGSVSQPAKICAVVKDYYCSHATYGVQPMLYAIHVFRGMVTNAIFTLKAYPGKEQELIDYLGKVHLKYFGTEDFNYHWYQEEIDEMYRDDKRLSDVCTLFSTIAILICSLGLLGLSLFDIRQRYKEIAIRKANGAHRRDLYLLLGKKYLYLLLFTFVLSIPVSYVLIHQYTESFIVSAPLTPIIYLEALGIVVLITLLTLIYQLEKAARVNVAMIVKTE